MIHPDTYIKSTEKGIGLFAKRRFLAGEILWICDEQDVKIPETRYLSMDPLLKKKLDVYSYLDSKRRVIVPWDEGKYVNHSCNPNSTGLLQFDNISVALRTIEADDEIVEDYNSYFGHFESFGCMCGSDRCRGIIAPNVSGDMSLRLDLRHHADRIIGIPQYLLSIQAEDIYELMKHLNMAQISVSA